MDAVSTYLMHELKNIYNLISGIPASDKRDMFITWVLNMSEHLKKLQQHKAEEQT